MGASINVVENNNKRIFVAIAAFNEPFLKNTILSAIEKSNVPGRIHFGINQSSSDGCIEDLSNICANIRAVSSIVDEPRGLGIDRFSAQTLWGGQDFYLQVDGHMIFENNWDSNLISDYEKILKTCGLSKAVISGHLPSWYAGEENKIPNLAPASIDCSPLYRQVAVKNNEPAYEMVEESAVCGDDVIEHFAMCGHFIFAPSSWIHEVGNDPYIRFVGEQTMLTMRSWTRGYRIFMPGKPSIWHLNKTPIHHDVKTSPSWRDLSNFMGRPNLFAISFDNERIKKYLTGQTFDKFGSPNKEALLAYEKVIGIDFESVYNFSS